MKSHIRGLTLLALLTMVGGVQAATLMDLEPLEDTLQPGETYTLKGTVFLACDEHEDGATVTYELLNSDEVSGILMESKDLTFTLADCQPSGQSIGQAVDGEETTLYLYDYHAVEVPITVDAMAQAFQPFTLETGVADTDNTNGDFTVEVAYNPAFEVDSLIEATADSELLHATIPITASSNADSILRFEVVDVQVDGMGVLGEAQPTVSEPITLSYDDMVAEGFQQVEAALEFHVPESTEGESAPQWSHASATLLVSMEAASDPGQKSEAVQVHVEFTNTDMVTNPETMGQENVDTPGYQAVAVLSVLGAAVAMVRRRS